MIFFTLLELSLIILTLYFIWSQFIKPSIEGRPILPFFSRETKLEKYLRELEQRDKENKLSDLIDFKNLKENVNKLEINLKQHEEKIK